MKSKIIIGVLGVAVLGLIFTILNLVVPRDQSTRIPTEVTNSVSFPVYYPAKLPEGIEVSTDFETSRSVVSSTYTYGGGKKLIMAQQTRPPITEDVKKTRDIQTSLGKAYIADLNGRTVGFVYTEKSLIILSTDGSKISDILLEEFIQSLKEN